MQNSILVVDDTEENHILLSVLFQARGFNVYNASNGREALEILNSLSVLPNLIMLDAQMPIMDGFQFRNEQVRSTRLQNIPVVVMSGDIDLALDEKMLHPKRILSKPLDVAGISEIASTYMN